MTEKEKTELCMAYDASLLEKIDSLRADGKDMKMAVRFGVFETFDQMTDTMPKGKELRGTDRVLLDHAAQRKSEAMTATYSAGRAAYSAKPEFP